MRFLLDVCVASQTLHKTLVDLGHDVLSARDGYSNATDEALLTLAYEEQRILITEDKDFGELVFLRRAPHPCIVRLVGLREIEKVNSLLHLIDYHNDAMQKGAIIVVTSTRIRIRPGTT